jgi:hypothetical protein
VFLAARLAECKELQEQLLVQAVVLVVLVVLVVVPEGVHQALVELVVQAVVLVSRQLQ